MSESDDFTRSDSSLGENWVTEYSGSGEMALTGENATWERMKSVENEWWARMHDVEPFTGIRHTIHGETVTTTLVNVAPILQAYPPPRNYIYFDDGRRVELTDRCAACGKHWGTGDVAVSENAQPFRHRDCADPTMKAWADE